MPEEKSSVVAKPTQTNQNPVVSDRRFELVKSYGNAILSAKPNSTPSALARDVIKFVDAVLEEYDKRAA